LFEANGVQFLKFVAIRYGWKMKITQPFLVGDPLGTLRRSQTPLVGFLSLSASRSRLFRCLASGSPAQIPGYATCNNFAFCQLFFIFTRHTYQEICSSKIHVHYIVNSPLRALRNCSTFKISRVGLHFITGWTVVQALLTATFLSYSKSCEWLSGFFPNRPGGQNPNRFWRKMAQTTWIHTRMCLNLH